MRQKTLTLKQMLIEGTRKLQEKSVPEPELDAWLLLEYVTGVPRALYYADPDRKMERSVYKKYEKCIERRCLRIPLQHITGEQEFMGYRFQVNESVLIPRQDTEILVEEAFLRLRSNNKILDMCTGSGCILLSLMKYSTETGKRTGIKGIGADISEKALNVARRNAGELDLEADFIESDLFDRVGGKFDMIVSNPPYIRSAVIDTLQDEVRLHDPYIALDGKEDGLYFYRKIVSESIEHIVKGGWLLFETGYDQAGEVSSIMSEAGYVDVTVKKDLAGLDRVVSGMYDKS